VILLSVGTQLPFDRLVGAVDRWAEARGRDDVVAQIGPTTYRPRALQAFAHADHDRFRELQAECALMVSHAGTGSIIAAMELGKPIIIMPRDHRRGEHRNGHQLATLREFGTRQGVYPAEDEATLVDLLDRADSLQGCPCLTPRAPADFVAHLAAHVRAPSPPTLVRRIRNLWQGSTISGQVGPWN